MQNQVLVINSGSSSIKFSLIDVSDNKLIISGLAEKLGMKDGRLVIQTETKKAVFSLDPSTHAGAMENIMSYLANNDLLSLIKAVGHRVVHGGEYFKSSTLISEEVLEAIRKCVPFAPLHSPANLLGIEAARQVLPNLPQVAVFDTAFHQTLPAHAYRYAVPADWYHTHGVRRYGFHGTSHRYVSQEAARMLNLPLEKTAFITAHLGNGSSVAAILGGKSVDTSMGFTPLEGLVMGTRSGDLDPGLFGYLAEVLKTDVKGIENQLNKKSGLLGLSGLSGDMRELQEAADEGHEGARLAINVFVFRLAKYIAALSVSLPRVDALVFTGGIGENAWKIREQTLQRLEVLGYRVNEAANQAAVRGKQGIISEEGGLTAMVVNTNEEWMIAMDTNSIVKEMND